MKENFPNASTYTRRNLLKAGVAGGGLMALAGSVSAQTAASGARTSKAADPTAIPVSLIGLPYLMGTRADNIMYSMAQGPKTLLADANAPTAMRSYFRDVEVTMIENVDEPPEPAPRGDQMARIFAQNVALASAVRAARARGRLPIAAIGTCSATLGMLAGLSDTPGDIGMIWFDAHSDASTPDNTTSGFIEGMVVPMIAGQTWKRYSAALPGFRSIDPSRIISAGIAAHRWPLDPNAPGAPMGIPVHKHEIDRLGVAATLGMALDQLSQRCKKVFIHFDADTIDPSFYRNFKNRPTLSGLTPPQITEAFDLIGSRFEILAVDFAAYDPTADSRSPAILSPLLLSAAKAAALSRGRV